MARIAFFGGTFDPVHIGHILIATTLLEQFGLDSFVFLPAFHAPHKPDRTPTSAYHRYAMLCLATASNDRLLVSPLEVEKGERRYTIDTLSELEALYADDERFFVMGADSWTDITTWREWEQVLLSVNHIVVSRPGFSLSAGHVPQSVRDRIVDIGSGSAANSKPLHGQEYGIYFTNRVNLDVSASELRSDLTDGELYRTSDVPAEVAKYIEKYDLYI
jgi:nicotinate-nucleotide adenylyltransferase